MQSQKLVYEWINLLMSLGLNVIWEVKPDGDGGLLPPLISLLPTTIS